MAAGIYLDTASQHRNGPGLDVVWVMTGNHMNNPERPITVSNHICRHGKCIEIFFAP